MKILNSILYGFCISSFQLYAMDIPKKPCSDCLETSPNASPRTEGVKRTDQEQEIPAVKNLEARKRAAIGCLFCCSSEQHY